ncbi:MAG: hypothetical protein ACKOB1_01120 [Planctomycetia bacterium]
MRSHSYHPLSLLLACALLAGSAGVGEEPAPAVKEVGPEIFYLRDDGGRLVPVPGFGYRDFVDLLRLKDGLPGVPQPPAAVLERIEVAGDLVPNGTGVCELTITLRLRQTRAGWARVPLALSGVALTAPPEHEGEGRLILDADSATPGYEAWLEAAVDSVHTVTLVGVVAVERGPAADTLRLDLPRATASLVRLRTPRDAPQVDVRPGGLAPQITPADGGGSIVECTGLSGAVTLRLASRTGGDRPGDAPPQATVDSVVRIDGTIASTEATLRLEGLPANTQEVRIALPPRTRIESVGEPATLVSVAGDAEAPEALVRIRPDAEGRAVVELRCERPIDATGAASVEPLGFAVAGVPAWRQRGRMSLVVEGDWQVDWDDPGSNRRVDPPLAARRPGFVAAFAYDSQPARLPLRVRPRGSRVVVEPTYRYEIGATRISLVATLRVIVRGAPVSRLVVGLDGWSVDDVGPASVVDVAAVSTEGGNIVIPLVQPLSGEATVEARCSLPVDRAAPTVGWKLPVPRADLVGPAQVTIASDSDIEVLPEPDGITGLVRQVAAPPRRGEAPRIAYRLDGTEGVFSARRRFLPRRVDATVAAQVTVGLPRTRVEETIRFDVANVPLEFVDLSVARPVLSSGGLEIRQAGELLNPFEVSAPADIPDEAAVVRVMLASPLLGAGDIVVAFGVTTPEVPAEATVAESVPLVVPVEARIVRQAVTLVAGDQFTVDVRGDAWSRDVAAATGSARVWLAANAQPTVPLALSLRPESGAGDTVIEAAWYQSRLLPERRDDIWTFAVSSTAPAVRLALPTPPRRPGEPAPSPPRIRVDGSVVTVDEEPDGTLRVPLPQAGSEAGRRRGRIEIESTAARRSAGGAAGPLERITLEAPRFPAGTILRRFYWELGLETDEHVVVPPAGWTAQQRWRWGPFGPEFAPLVSPAALAEWIASAVQRPAPTAEAPLAERRMVYAGVGDPGSAAVWVAPTWLLVLVASGLTLAVGLAMIYRSALRRVPAVLTIGAAAVMAAAFVPDLAPLVGLAALPGAVLALVAAALRLAVDRPARRPPAPGLPVSPESSTRFAPGASILIAPSVAASSGNATRSGSTAS